MRTRRISGAATAVTVALSSIVGLSATPAPEATAAYIVEVAPGETSISIETDVVDELEVTETFDAVLDGFVAELTPTEAEELAASPDVLGVYEDLPISLTATQSNAPWNLSRLDQDALPVDSSYTYPDSAGSGARVYVVDTGVSANATQLGSRLLSGMTAIADGRGTADCNGHGTHVAGTVASTSYGVAKLAKVVPVRVFGCTGSTLTSTVISGLNWIVANHPAGTPGIVNMSLGSNSPIATTTPDALTNAVNTMVDNGFVVVVAAGNETDDACSYSPSRAAKALTVAATTSTDARASYSNFGSCVDLFAPGSSIRSLQWNDPNGSSVKSGTSMAAPHVAGLAAVIWTHNSGTSRSSVENQLLDAAVLETVTDPEDSPNRLASMPVGMTSLPSAPPATSATAVYRFWSDQYQSHFYTRSVTERNHVATSYPDSVWRYEGAVFGAFGTPVAGSIPVYRFWSSAYNAHFYTASEGEKNHVIAAYPDEVWKYESVAYYAYPRDYVGVETRLMARFWSPTYLNHFFTASSGEATSVTNNYPDEIWTFEGNVFRVPATFSPATPLP